MKITNVSQLIIKTPAGPLRPGDSVDIPDRLIQHAKLAYLIKAGFLKAEEGDGGHSRNS